jgi:glucose-6-phosphate 1-dehydrogenase
VVRLKRPPALFAASSLTANALRFRISPTITIAFAMNGMKPGDELTGEMVEMIAVRDPHPEDTDPYERLLSDALEGDATQFARQDYVEQAWRIVDPVLSAGTPVLPYGVGSWGPEDPEGRVTPAGGWHNPLPD